MLQSKIFTNNFSVTYSGKNGKECSIPDAKVDAKNQLTIHQRQAICESFIVHKNYGHVVPRELSLSLARDRTTYVFAHIGCVISDRAWPSANTHKRIFITAPMFNGESMFKGAKLKTDLHAEESFVNFVTSSTRDPKTGQYSESNIEKAFIELFKEKEVEEPHNRKIYAIVFDLHGSQDMCDEKLRCEKELLDLQIRGKEFYNLVRYILEGDPFRRGLVKKLPKMEKDSFKIIVRYSAVRNCGASICPAPHELNNYDIKRLTVPVIFHSDEKMKAELKKWYEEESYKDLEEVLLPAQTVFVNKNGIFPEFKIPSQLQARIKGPQ